MIMKWRFMKVIVALIALSLSLEAKIVANGPWTGNDIYEQYYRVNNGVPYFTY